MQKDNKQTPFVNIGSSLLLVIFLILCLVTFATLSLSSARSDYSFSERAAERRTQYYQACNTAEDVLAQIDGILEKAVSSSSRDENWINNLNLTQIDDQEFVDIGLNIALDVENASISYQIPVNEKQNLEVKLALTDHKTKYYQIEKWQLVNTGSRENNQTLQLIPMP